MTKNILSCPVFSMGIEWVFSMARKICRFDWKQMTSQAVEEIMFLKYYNHTQAKKQKNQEKLITESWNLLNKEQKIDHAIDDEIKVFYVHLNYILQQHFWCY